MASPTCNILDLYQQIVTARSLQFFQTNSCRKVRRGIYCARVVLWMMILQRLHHRATLSMAVQLLIEGAAGPLMEDCHRVRCGKLSSRTGSYCQARQKLPALLCKQVSQQIVEQLQLMMGLDADFPRVVLMDGSSIELEHSRDLLKRYPPAQNQHGKSHWPVLRIVVAHGVDSGLAHCPCWGPMYGSEAVSEQALAEEMMSQLKPGTTILADRNFGVFWVAYQAHQCKLRSIVRLTERRARKLGGVISEPGEREVIWKSSKRDGGKARRFETGSCVSGRLIAARIGRGKSKEWLYLFTTLELPWEEVVAIYGRRWNIEMDLRSLKRTVNLHHVDAKSQDMLDKELLMAMAAYNLTQAVMVMAARRHGLAARQLSFSGVLNVVTCAWPHWMEAKTKRQMAKEIERTLRLAAQQTLPKRKTPRSYPRAVWRHNQAYPVRPSEKIS